jgi:hypothetical protein
VAKNNQNTIQPANQTEKAVQEQPRQNPKPSQRKSKKYRSLSRFIETFEHKGILYTIHPNSVVENLPEDAPQVKRLIEQKKLIKIK